MPIIHQLFYFNLPIPVWQIALYAGLMSFFLINRRVRLSLLTSYLFLLFWLYYAFRGDLLSLTKEDSLVQAAYHIFGCVLAALGVFAYFFLDRGQEVLLENLRKRNAEIGELKLKARKAEKTALALEARVEEARHGLHSEESGYDRKLENEINAKIDQLEDRLEDKEDLLEKRDAEIAELKSKAKEAERKAQALKDQVEEARRNAQSDASFLKKKLEQELNGKMDGLEDRLEESQTQLVKRNREIADLKLKAEEAENKALALKEEAEEIQRRSRAEAATLKKNLDLRIDDLEKQLADRERLLEQRTVEIAAHKQKILEEKQQAQALKAAAEEARRSARSEAATLTKKLEQELNVKVADLEGRLKEREELLKKGVGEIAAFKQKAENAEQLAHTLKGQLEESQRGRRSEASALNSKLEQELNAKIKELGDRLRESESLVEKRNGEIAAFKSQAEDAEKRAQALKTQAEESRRALHTESSVLKKKLDARIDELEKQLRDKDTLLAKRAGEIADFKQKVEETELASQALKTKIEHNQRDLHTEASVVKKRLDARIDELEASLKAKDGLLAKRAAELADLKLKAEEAEKTANALKAHAHETQRSSQAEAASLKKKLEQELNTKIEELEQRLKDRDGLLAKRNGELAALKLDAEKRAHVLKAQIEETQKTAQTLMAQVAETQRSQTRESDLKKKLEQEFQVKVGEIERRLKESEALLAQRNTEIAALKSAAEADKKAPAVKSQGTKERPGAQPQDANNKKSLELEIKEKAIELKQLQEQINHKDGLLSLMAKRNAELADLKSRADQRVELLEAQLQESRPVLRAEESVTLKSYKPRDS